MGVLRSTQSLQAEVDELRAALLAGGGGHEASGGWRRSAGGRHADTKRATGGDAGGAAARAVCVTGGISFVGFAVVDRLLRHGYTVRLALETQEDMDKLREMEMFGEDGRDGVWTVMANVMDPDSLHRAFDGCAGVFHTSAFVDPGGMSGYTKHMATLEAQAAERVIEACVRTESVRKCVFTSSLLACVWRQNYPHDRRCPTIIDESCWSDESFCRDNKLWFALGKTAAEKAAWRAARGRDLKLVTICPALVTGPGFRRRNSTASIAYLKGARAMLADGLLATANVETVAEAHVHAYEAGKMTQVTRQARDETAGANISCIQKRAQLSKDVCNTTVAGLVAGRPRHVQLNRSAGREERHVKHAERPPPVVDARARFFNARPYATEPRGGDAHVGTTSTTTSCASLTTQPAPAPRVGSAWKWAGSIMARTDVRTHGTGRPGARRA